MVPVLMTLSDPNWVSRSRHFWSRISQNCAYYGQS